VLHADHASNALFDLPYERSVVGELPSIEDPIHTLQEPLAVRSVRKADVAWLIEQRLPSPPGEVAENVLSPQSNALCMGPEWSTDRREGFDDSKARCGAPSARAAEVVSRISPDRTIDTGRADH
jgi:hypothetical protein